jgi:hypothetical protein
MNKDSKKSGAKGNECNEKQIKNKADFAYL